MAVSETPDPDSPLTDDQRTLLDYLRETCDTQTYFKSKLIGNEIGLSSKQVGQNILKLQKSERADITIEKWGASSSTTWRITP